MVYQFTFVLAIYFMALTGAILHAYPGIFQDLLRTGPVPPESPLKTLPPTYFSASAAGSEKFEASPPTSIYRQNIQRTGADTENSVSPELKLAWAHRPFNVGIHTASKASPAVDSTGIYIGTDDAWFYAFDREGQVRWKFHVSGASRGIHGTASLDENRVYFGAYNGSLYCLDKKTGALIWTVQLGVALGASPVLSGDFVYAGVELVKPLDGFVVKVNRADGRVIWASPSMGEQTHSSPTLNVEAELVYSGANNGRFFAYEILTGKIRWSIDLGDAVKSTSALVNNILYISSWSKTLTAVNPLTGETLWQSKLEGKARSSPSFVPGLNILIIEDEVGHVYGFAAKSGKQLWTFDSKINPLIASALVIKDFHKKYLAWLPCAPNVFCSIDPATGKIQSNYPIPTEMTSVPVAWGHDLYIALDKEGGLLKYTSLH